MKFVIRLSREYERQDNVLWCTESIQKVIILVKVFVEAS